jgi:hypothetical protein
MYVCMYVCMYVHTYVCRPFDWLSVEMNGFDVKYSRLFSEQEDKQAFRTINNLGRIIFIASWSIFQEKTACILKQGCHIFLDTTYQNGKKIYQITNKYPKRP